MLNPTKNNLEIIFGGCRKKIFFFSSLLFLLIPLPVSAETQTISLTTYYPAPAAVYDRVRLIPRAEITGTNCTGQFGTLYLNKDKNNLLYFCQDDGTEEKWGLLPEIWTQTGNNIFLTDTPDPLDDKNENSIPDVMEKKVGINTKTPQFKLTMDNNTDDAGILALGTPSGQLLGDLAAGEYFIWYPKKAALLAGSWPNGLAEAEIGTYSVIFGKNNKETGLGKNSILGGSDNTTNGTGTIIGGGESNTISSVAGSVIGGGENNHNEHAAAFLGGGLDNQIPGTTNLGAIGGGKENQCKTMYCAIIGGESNEITAWDGHIGGGYNNTSSGGNGKHVGGGKDNVAGGGHYGGILGGYNNRSEGGVTCIIGGGQNNTIALGEVGYIAIIGGESNKISADPGSIIFGGQGNSIAHSFSTIGGGAKNEVLHQYSFIGGGGTDDAAKGNVTDKQYSTIGGGKGNKIGNQYSFIGGGSGNEVNGTHSVIPGGKDNFIDGNYNFAGGTNMRLTAKQSFVWGLSNSPITIEQDDAFIITYDSSLGPDPTKVGNVGIGTKTPQEKLHVVGDVQIDNGTIVVLAPPTTAFAGTPLLWDGATQKIGLDLAENFSSSETIEPGDTLVIDSQHKGQLKKSIAPYDKKVIGVVSAAPAILLEGDQMQVSPKPFDSQQKNTPPVALAGRVGVKVSLENGPILAGDPLTTSSLAGHAMKATDAKKSLGAIIGKALENFDGNADGKQTGVVMMMVAGH